MSTIQSSLEAALAHHRAGQLAEAEAIYRQVLTANPNEPNALHLLGLVAHQTGHASQAVEIITRAIQFAPQMPLFYNTLGAAYQALGRRAEASAAYHQALTLNPGYDEAWFNLGSIANEQNDQPLAEQRFRKAIGCRPNYALAWCSLGNALVKQGRLSEGTDAYRRATEFDPRMADAWNNLGNMQQQDGEIFESIESYQRALAVAPRHVSSAENLGTALAHIGRISEAVDCYRAVSNWMGNLPSSKLLLAINYDADRTADEVFAEHQRFGAWLESTTPRMPPPQVDLRRDRKLRVGYVSGDFRDHAVAHFLMAILQHHDRQQFELFGYSDVLIRDSMTDRLQSFFAGWRECYGAGDEQLAEVVRKDAIDILVDMSGHTSLSRLGVFARRPAPVQATYLGYANTTGLSTIDYLVTDAVVDPPGSERWYTEQLARVEPGFACYTPPENAPAVTPLPALDRGHVTIGSLHGLAKLNRHVLDLWARVLEAMPSARMLLYRHTLRGRSRQMIYDEFARRGIDPARLDIETEAVAGANHLAIYNRVDVTLDVFPWSGHTTACEALWMGVPIITLRGTRHAGRMVASALNCLGRNEWIADSHDQYLQRVVAMCDDLESLSTTRATLREQMRTSALCDGPRFARQFEATLRQMWHTRCDQA